MGIFQFMNIDVFIVISSEVTIKKCNSKLKNVSLSCSVSKFAITEFIAGNDIYIDFHKYQQENRAIEMKQHPALLPLITCAYVCTVMTGKQRNGTFHFIIAGKLTFLNFPDYSNL